MALLLTALLGAAACRASVASTLASRPAPSLAAEAESALWTDHADVRDACFVLSRARVDARELAAALEAELAKPGLPALERRRLRRLLALVGAGGSRCAAPKPL